MTAHDPQPDRSAAATSVYTQRINVPFEYPVHFTRGLFAPGSDLLAATLDRLNEGRRHRAAVFLDAGLADAQPRLQRAIEEAFHADPKRMELAGGVHVIPGGPAAKAGWDVVRDVMWTLGNAHLDRQSYAIAIGGGSVLDAVGFAASIVHRGLRLVRVPSTTLAQGDSGIGVKNGMDEHGQKNFVGTFAPPFAVINDLDLLDTLPDEHWRGGLAEAVKVALIRDAALLDDIAATASALRGRDREAMARVVRRSAVIHLQHIRSSGDPFEFGSARPLDFGHWAGHRLEVMSGFTLGHGQAVAVGIAVDTCYAAERGLLTAHQRDRVLSCLVACGLPIWDDLLARRRGDGQLEILEGIEQFREHLGGRLTVTLPDGLGQGVEVHTMDDEAIERAVHLLANRREP